MILFKSIYVFFAWQFCLDKVQVFGVWGGGPVEVVRVVLAGRGSWVGGGSEGEEGGGGLGRVFENTKEMKLN